MAEPSTRWKERIAVDELMHHTLYANEFTQIQALKAGKRGKGRALHRKQILGLKASIEIHGGLPEYARQGLFAEPATHDAMVRLSNGAPDVQDDRKPDVRGFAIKVWGVSGPGALGQGPTNSQDFLLINHPAFLFPTSEDFVAVVRRSLDGPRAVFRYLSRRYGFFGAVGKLLDMRKMRNRPFSGFASEAFYSAAPIACGPYAARVRLLPAVESKGTDAARDWAEEFRNHLAAGPLRFELQLQFFVDEARTPIEDASVDWPEDVAPYVTVATITVPPQDPLSILGKSLSAKAEATAFDPWRALMAHRPLGEVMRARRIVYYESQKGRIKH